MNSPFPTLETIPDLCAVAAEWRACMGEAFPGFSNFLQKLPQPARSFPCLCKWPCAYDIVHCSDGSIVGICPKHRTCPDLKLNPDDITIWELNWPKFARALCHAFGLVSKYEELGFPNTSQIGTWSADPVPAILTIQEDEDDFRHVVTGLVARQHSPFILLGPTAKHMDATSQSYLANIGAEFFPLETNLTLTEHGAFQPAKLPGEIFARFRPEPIDVEEILRKTIALVKAVDSGQENRRVTLYTVMRLYCFDHLEAKQIARRCACALSLAYRRLDELRQTLGRDLAELRAYSDQFERLEKDLTDLRAKRIHRPSAIPDDEDTNQHD